MFRGKILSVFVRCTGVFSLLMFAGLTPMQVQAQTAVTVIEYYNRTLDAYFITGRGNEQEILDRVVDFQRTGMSFSAVSAGTAPASLSQICRYYVNTTEPFTNSHFYGVKDTDCVLIANAKPAGFSNEGFDFATALPGAGGCPASAPTAVYRTFRLAASGKSSNHRYTTSTSIRDSMIARGWVSEGIAFCAPGGTTTPQSPSIASFDGLLLNGGLYNLRFGTTTTSGQTRADYIIALQTQSSASPSAAGLRIDSPYINVSKTLPLPDTSTWVRERTFDSSRDALSVASVNPARFFISYIGDGVRIDTLTDDAKATAFSSIITGATTVPLSGTLSTLPAEISALYPQLIPGALTGLNTNVSWLPGAAYQKRTNTRLSDTYFLGDCDTPQTFGSELTPCRGTAGKKIEAFFPWQDNAQGKTWQLSDGTIRTIPNGPRVWIANTKQPTSANATTSYRAYYEGDDAMFHGVFSPSGAVVSANTANGVVGYQIRFNKAAIDSITAALNF